MDILLNTLHDAIPMFITLASIAGFIALVYLVVTVDAPKPSKRRLTMDMVRDTRYMNLE